MRKAPVEIPLRIKSDPHTAEVSMHRTHGKRRVNNGITDSDEHQFLDSTKDHWQNRIYPKLPFRRPRFKTVDRFEDQMQERRNHIYPDRSIPVGVYGGTNPIKSLGKSTARSTRRNVKIPHPLLR